MTVTPLGDKVLIVRKKEEQMTDSGIFIPDSVLDPSQQAHVLAVGVDNTTISVGDVVITGKYAGAQIDIHGKVCFIVELDDILGIVNE